MALIIRIGLIGPSTYLGKFLAIYLIKTYIQFLYGKIAANHLAIFPYENNSKDDAGDYSPKRCLINDPYKDLIMRVLMAPLRSFKGYALGPGLLCRGASPRPLHHFISESNVVPWLPSHW